MKLKHLNIDEIRIDGGTQPRAGIDTAYIADLAERLDGLPPIDVFFDGKDHWAADGFHRYHAHRKAEKKTIPCNIHKGTQRDAILFSVGANNAHGLRRTNADKRRAVETLLGDKEWGKRSDRWIADQCKVSNHLVAEIRGIQVGEFPPANAKNRHNDTENDDSGGRIPTCRDGKDGKKYPAPEVEEDDIPVDSESESPSAPPAPPAVDKLGEPIADEAIASIFARARELDDLARRTSELKVAIQRGVEAKDELFARFNATDQVNFSNGYAAIKANMPYCVCRGCKGRSRETGTCMFCKKTGWLTKAEYERMPKELKAGGGK